MPVNRQAAPIPQHFLFKNYAWDSQKGALHLHYGFDGFADQASLEFEEIIEFPLPKQPVDEETKAAFDRACRLVFLLAGVSYYKLFAPVNMLCTAFALDTQTIRLVEKVYRHGLGEFLQQNNLVEQVGNIAFGAAQERVPESTAITAPLKSLKKHHLIPIGGGKDSIVTLETLHRGMPDIPITLFALGSAAGIAAPIAATIAASGLPALQVTRTLSPQLLVLNQAGQYQGQRLYNGHVPITAILSAIAVACAILHGIDRVVLSNERSANEANMFFNGDVVLPINHQYSKSFEFERDFDAYVRHALCPNLHYFSFLRPLSEVAIARHFATLTAYHALFRSCNTAFKQDAARRNKNWCGNCPKCRFVFLALAPFLSPQQLEAIFGANLLQDASQQQGFADLCGLGAHKPFECVGEVKESLLLLKAIASQPAWQNAAVVQGLRQQINALKDDRFGVQRIWREKTLATLFAPEKDPQTHLLEQDYMRLLDGL